MGSGAARGSDGSRETVRSVAAVLLGIMFLAAGANHFANTDFYLSMMPDYLPWHREAVHVSGLLEMVGGAAVLIRAVRPAAGLFLCALLVAVFPANVEMAMHPEDFPAFSPVTLWARLPLQAVLIFWAWWATRDRTAA